MKHPAPVAAWAEAAIWWTVNLLAIGIIITGLIGERTPWDLVLSSVGLFCWAVLQVGYALELASRPRISKQIVGPFYLLRHRGVIALPLRAFADWFRNGFRPL